MSNKIDNSLLVLELFNFKKGLNIEQEDIERQINFHLNLFQGNESGNISQKKIISNLNEKLEPETFNKDVKKLVERLNNIIRENELFYDLEDLYRTLESNNQGQVLRPIMSIVLDIINESNERTQQIKILNELSIHSWNRDVKNFLLKYTTDPKERQNITSQGGKAEPVFTLVEKISTKDANGFLTYVGDKWFFINENNIEPATPSDLIKEAESLHKINLLQKALQISTIEDEKIHFNVQEDLKLSISLKNSDILINEEKVAGSKLESIFESPIVPFMRLDLYPIVACIVENKDKIVDLDIVQKITNITNPFLESYVFNYKNNMYTYSMDKRYGHHFHQYESATMLVNEIKNSLGYDMAQFLKDKFNKETQVKMDLEDKEKFITSKLTEISEGLLKLENSGLLGVNEQINLAYETLKEDYKKNEDILISIKESLNK